MTYVKVPGVPNLVVQPGLQTQAGHACTGGLVTCDEIRGHRVCAVGCAYILCHVIMGKCAFICFPCSLSILSG